MRRKLVGFGFGEDFCKIAILLRDIWSRFQSRGIDSRQKLGERGDGIEVENIELIARSDFTS